MIVKSSNGYEFLIDDEDFNKISFVNWFVDKRGYVRCSGSKRKSGVDRLHRFILNAPEGLTVDHINGNKLDNRRSNLRICTQSENCKNRGLNKKMKGKYKGARWKEKNKKWQATIRHNTKDIYLGLYETEEEAALAYNRKAVELHGEFAKLNEL